MSAFVSGCLFPCSSERRQQSQAQAERSECWSAGDEEAGKCLL